MYRRQLLSQVLTLSPKKVYILFVKNLKFLGRRPANRGGNSLNVGAYGAIL